MKNYYVKIPISGFIEVEVQAENKSEAINKAFGSEDLSLENVGEWEAHESICTGNVCHAICTDIGKIAELERDAYERIEEFLKEE